MNFHKYIRIFFLAMIICGSFAHNASAESGTKVTILGSLAGQTSYRGSPLGGPSVAVSVNGARYIVDFGRGWADRYFESGLAAPGGPRNGFENIRAAFITHMHTDHLVDISNLLLFGQLQGAGRKQALQIFGPGRRGEAVPLSAALTAPPPVVNPKNPYPSTQEMISQLLDGYAAALNDVIRDSGFPAPASIFSVHDIQLPPGLVPPSVNVAPDMEPIKVYSDENVKVSAILVDHQPTYPSFAYKFETADGAIVITGDTAVTGNLLKLAKGADVLVSEVISMKWLDEFLPEPRNAQAKALHHHIQVSHIAAEEIGPTAEKLGIKNLVLYHFAPPDYTDKQWRDAVTGFSGQLYIGFPLTNVTIGGNKK